MKINDKGVTAKKGIQQTQRVTSGSAKVSFAERLAAKKQELSPPTTPSAQEQAEQERMIVDAVGVMVAQNTRNAPPAAQIEMDKPNDEES